MINPVKRLLRWRQPSHDAAVSFVHLFSLSWFLILWSALHPPTLRVEPSALAACLPLYCSWPDRPRFVWIQHVQRSAGSWLCLVASENMGGNASLADEDDYRCEPEYKGQRLTLFANVSNAELLRIGVDAKVVASQWDAFDPRRFELKAQGVGFVAVLREPIERMCSWMAYARPTYNVQSDLVGFVKRRKPNPMTRMFAAPQSGNVTLDHAQQALATLSRFDKIFIQEDLADGRFGLNPWDWRYNLTSRVNERPNTKPTVPCAKRLSRRHLEEIQEHLQLDSLLFSRAKDMVREREAICEALRGRVLAPCR